ncbi:MAG: alkaline phosphatase family protein, partial [Muribaculaceae bacterium]|nr:alkaline phosphatase family protein [Muribaculaceae bacterium]
MVKQMHRKQTSQLKSYLTGALMASVCGLTLNAQAPAARPQLVVGIMIDGLSADYLTLLKGYMSEGGFKRLMQEGVTLTDLDYGTSVDAATATAIAFTGAVPAVNGIGASTVYNPELKISRPVFYDPAVMGNYTDETLSPARLRVSTIADEIRIAGGGLGSVYSIAPDASTAIIMAGHAGNSAAWINDVTGNWASSAFYKEMPVNLQSRNRMQPLATRLDTLAWVPVMNSEKYPDIPSYKKAYPMRNTFLRKDPNRFRAFKTSAPVNSEVTTIASDYISSLKLGGHDETDVLNIAYTVQPYEYSPDADARIEQMDIYLRLDRDLQKLFSAIDAGPGMDKTMIFVAGTPRRARSRRDDEKWSIPHGEFSPRRAMSLLNVYLIALHGNGEWVSGFHDKQIYLNQSLAKERGIEMASLRSDVASFM